MKNIKCIKTKLTINRPKYKQLNILNVYRLYQLKCWFKLNSRNQLHEEHLVVWVLKLLTLILVNLPRCTIQRLICNSDCCHFSSRCCIDSTPSQEREPKMSAEAEKDPFKCIILTGLSRLFCMSVVLNFVTQRTIGGLIETKGKFSQIFPFHAHFFFGKIG